MKSEKIAKEVAEQEFQRMCELARVDADESTMSKEDLEKWQELRASLVRLIQIGAISVDATGAPSCAGLTFKAPTGAAFIALETYGEGKNMSNLAAAMCELTGSDKGTFAKMHARDFQNCSQIAKLFLG